MEFSHKPVLLDEVIEELKIRPEGIYLDGTLGGGGHSFAIASHLSGKGRLIGIDQDADAIAAAAKRLSPMSGRVTIVRSNYRSYAEVLDRLEVAGVDGILLDLGVSSFQLDEAERGFTYREDAPLDMRMDREGPRTAADVVNNASEEELRRILYEYGEERFAKGIAREIVRRRQEKPITGTGELTEIIRSVIPAKLRGPQTGHPAKRTFQALRIEVNHELDVLEESLEGMIKALTPGGRICVITFHSLEDRIVKQQFRKAENPCTCPPEFPVCVCGKKPLGRVVTRKPILPSQQETEENPRAKSAKLRVFEKY